MTDYLGRQANAKNAYDAIRAADPLNHARSLMKMLNDRAHSIPETYRSSIASRLPQLR